MRIRLIFKYSTQKFDVMLIQYLTQNFDVMLIVIFYMFLRLTTSGEDLYEDGAAGQHLSRESRQRSRSCTELLSYDFYRTKF